MGGLFSRLLLGLEILRSFLFLRPSTKNHYANEHSRSIDALPESGIAWRIALIAGVSLFLELMVIRLHASYFQLFAYFKNVSLLSCFLGLGIGYARGQRGDLATVWVLPAVSLQIVALYALRFSRLAKHLQNPISEELTLGFEPALELAFVLLTYGFIIVVFASNALCFIPLGQLAARLMARRQKLVAYSWNLVGSIAGILLFSLISYLQTPPRVWLLVGAAGLCTFLSRPMRHLVPSIVSVVLAILVLSLPVREDHYDVYSPYQILTVSLGAERPPVIQTSNTYYQRILDLREEVVAEDPKLESSAQYYSLPYFLRPEPQRVLIVGSGTGNDVAAALRNGADSVVAVEIDPAILRFGRELHPEAPYDAPEVRTIVDDARAYIRHTDEEYDLIVYGLLDSHSLLSSRSGGIRLDSYVYTVEAFREARSRLSKDGLLSLTFCLMRDEIGRKLYLMLEDAFDGAPPVVYQAGYDGGVTFIAGENLTGDALPVHPVFDEVTERYANPELNADKSTDDWPFIYMPVRKYPVSYIVMILFLVGASLVGIRRFVTGTGAGFSIPCFFLGAGFMLVETKGITELALIYGSTWIVTGIVIAAILLMAFLANLVAMRLRNPSMPIIYGLLGLALLVGLASVSAVSGRLPQVVLRIAMPIALSLPLFFSGLAFSSELRRTESIGVALSSNLLGAMVGGFLEYNSMYFGFRSLYVIALLMYAVAYLGTRHRSRTRFV